MNNMKLNKYLFLLLATSLSFSALSEEPTKNHDDKEHDKAESNLDHGHWEKAHGSGDGATVKKEGRKPGGTNGVKSSTKSRAIRE
jgi:hypothetical protein